jgi:hypothetical protein
LLRSILLRLIYARLAVIAQMMLELEKCQQTEHTGHCGNGDEDTPPSRLGTFVLVGLLIT